MLTYTYVSEGTFALMEKPKPVLQHERDAIVKVTLASICSSDLHIKHGSVPRAVPGITVGHEMVGIVEEVGSAVTNVKPGDRVTVNVETFCGECFFCKKGFVNNCTDQNGGWALGCRIDGGQAEYVRVPFADQGLNKIPDGVTDRQALLVGDVLATGFWAARISEITPEDTVLILGAGPTGICTLLCVMLHSPKRIIVCEKDASRLQFIRQHYPQVLTVQPEDCAAFVRAHSDHGGADVVLEVAGADSTFRLAWECARPNAIVTVVALYDKAQTLPLPEMYGKNLTFKTGGVDGCDCEETLRLIAEGKIDTYLRPLYDALYQIMGAESFAKNSEKGLIEVAPLAYMRGRTLDNAFIILDEAQNTTPAQMKMFLTRIGFGSKVVITGDATQKDLPAGTVSGLDVAVKVVKNLEGISICTLTSKDVVRHPLVQKIVKAYEEYEKKSTRTKGGTKRRKS